MWKVRLHWIIGNQQSEREDGQLVNYFTPSLLKTQSGWGDIHFDIWIWIRVYDIALDWQLRLVACLLSLWLSLDILLHLLLYFLWPDVHVQWRLWHIAVQCGKKWGHSTLHFSPFSQAADASPAPQSHSKEQFIQTIKKPLRHIALLACLNNYSPHLSEFRGN